MCIFAEGFLASLNVVPVFLIRIRNLRGLLLLCLISDDGRDVVPDQLLKPRSSRGSSSSRNGSSSSSSAGRQQSQNPAGAPKDTTQGLWPEYSMLNHSCEPNTCVSLVGDRLLVRAARHMEAGEEVRGAGSPGEQENSTDSKREGLGFIGRGGSSGVFELPALSLR
jgi:hypothetical protein